MKPFKPEIIHHRRIAPADEKQYDLDIREAPRNAPSTGIFDEPLRCYILNEEWDAHISGAISALTEWRAWVGDEDERNTAVQEVMKLLGEDNCMQFQLRQNPDNNCQLQQSLDGGNTWSLAYDYSLCVSPAVSTQGLQDSIDALTALLTAFDGSVGSVAPDMVYDASNTDNLRDIALCHALRELVDLMCEMELEYRRQIALIANITSIGLALLGVAFAIGTAGTATPFYMAVSSAISGGFATIFGGLSTLILNDETARDAVACCMFTALAGATITQATFEDSLDGCGFAGGSNEAQLAGAVSQLLEKDDMYESFLDYMQRAFKLANLGLATCNCTTPFQIFIPFSTLSDPLYSLSAFTDSNITVIVPFDLQNTEQGNPIPASKASYGSANGTSFKGLNLNIVVTLSSISTIHNVAFDYYYFSPLANNVLARSIVLRDAGGAGLASWSDSGNNATKNAWTNISQSFGTVANVATIECRISLVGGGTTSANIAGWIDNIIITGS